MNEKISLTELQLIIRDSLYLALPDMYWIIAEIAEIKENSAGHCYLELIEKHPEANNVRARAKGIIWSKRFRFIKSYFENITGESLREGLKILVKTKVEYHEIYGLSLVITDIDPAFTIGEMALKRQLAIKRLEQEGVFNMNKDLALPLLPQRIAVISSRSAAGYTDFLNHLNGNRYGYVFYTALIESAMQGKETEQEVINALDRIAGNITLFDLVVIIRGGGSQTDLTWFDSYSIAYHITQFPIPVITGIGHDKDMSVSDLVACRALKTPTAVADFIIDCVGEVDTHLTEISSAIMDHVRHIIEKNSKRIESSRIRLLPLTRIMISEIKERLSDIIIEIINTGKDNTFRAGLVPANHTSRLISGIKSILRNNESSLDRRSQKLRSVSFNSIETNRTRFEVMDYKLKILNPESVLRRGYTITSFNGVILKNNDVLTTNDIIDTQFSDGRIRSKVTEKNDQECLDQSGRKKH